MLGVSARPAVAKVIAPVVARLGRAGVTPDMVTVTGTVGAVASAAFVPTPAAAQPADLLLSEQTSAVASRSAAPAQRENASAASVNFRRL